MYNLYYQDLTASTPIIDFAGAEFPEFLHFLDSFLFLSLLGFSDLVVFLVFWDLCLTALPKFLKFLVLFFASSWLMAAFTLTGSGLGLSRSPLLQG